MAVRSMLGMSFVFGKASFKHHSFQVSLTIDKADAHRYQLNALYNKLQLEISVTTRSDTLKLTKTKHSPLADNFFVLIIFAANSWPEDF